MSMLPLTQSVTFWEVSGVDGNSAVTFSTGVRLPARWVRKDGVARSDKGDDIKTEFIIYTNTEIPKRSMVVLSDMGGVALPPSSARQVVAIVDNVSISNLVKHLM